MSEGYVKKLLHGKAIKKCALWFNLIVDFGDSCVLYCDEGSFFLKGDIVLACKDTIGLTFVDFIKEDGFEIFLFENDVQLRVPLIDVEHWLYENSDGVIMVSN